MSRGDYNNREPRPYRPSVEPDNRPIGIFDRSDPHHSVDSLPFGDERSRRRRSASPGPGLGPSRDRYGRAGFDAGEGGGRGREDLERDTRGNINYSREQDYRIGDSTSYHHRLSAPPPPHDRYDEEPASYFRGVRGGRSEGGFGDDFARGNTGGGRTNAPLSYHNDGYDHTDPYTHPRPVPPPMHQGGHRNGERDFPSYDDPRIPPPRRYDQQNQYSRPGPPTTSDKQMQLPEARGRTGEGNDRWERGRNVDREAEDWLDHVSIHSMWTITLPLSPNFWLSSSFFLHAFYPNELCFPPDTIEPCGRARQATWQRIPPLFKHTSSTFSPQSTRSKAV